MREPPWAKFLSNLSKILGVGRQLLGRQKDGQLDRHTDIQDDPLNTTVCVTI